MIDYQERYFRAREPPTDMRPLESIHYSTTENYVGRTSRTQDKDHVFKQHAFPRSHPHPSSLLRDTIDLRSTHCFYLTLDTPLDLGTRKVLKYGRHSHTEPLVQQGRSEMSRYIEVGHQDIHD